MDNQFPFCSLHIPSNGQEIPMLIFECNIFDVKSSDMAKEIVKNKSKEQLIRYINEILLGIEMMKLESLKMQCPHLKCGCRKL